MILLMILVVCLSFGMLLRAYDTSHQRELTPSLARFIFYSLFNALAVFIAFAVILMCVAVVYVLIVGIH